MQKTEPSTASNQLFIIINKKQNLEELDKKVSFSFDIFFALRDCNETTQMQGTSIRSGI